MSHPEKEPPGSPRRRAADRHNPPRANAGRVGRKSGGTRRVTVPIEGGPASDGGSIGYHSLAGIAAQTLVIRSRI